MKQTKSILTPSIYVFAYELQEAILDGWEIDGDVPPVTWGIAYEVGLMREVDENAPKLTRAEILARAREAKAAKADQKNG